MAWFDEKPMIQYLLSYHKKPYKAAVLRLSYLSAVIKEQNVLNRSEIPDYTAAKLQDQSEEFRLKDQKKTAIHNSSL